MEIIAWLALGALAGWLASIIMGTNAQMGALANIVVGIVGAMIGGFIANLFGGAGPSGFNIWSIFVSVIGAVLLLAIVKAVRKPAA